VIATGSSPAVLPELPFDGQRILSSSDLLVCKEFPASLLIIGGGYIGVELGTAFAKLGSRVTLLEASKTILPGVDPDLVQLVTKRLRQLGVQVLTQATVSGGRALDSEVQLTALIAGQEQQLSAAYCMVAVGRNPNTKGLGLEQLNVELDQRGFIQTDQQCQTSTCHIYAIGDCTQGALLAHKASYEGKLVAEVLAGQDSVKDCQALPYVIFSDPELAYVGLTARQAQDEGYKIVVSRFPLAANGRALTQQISTGFVQVVAEEITHKLLGVQMAGPDVSNLISEAALALEAGASAEDLSLTVHPHPTLSECLVEAAEGIFGCSIHHFKQS
jgi:dihydrolipoamide dehydrogenase